MVDTQRFVEGMAYLTKAEELLGTGSGFPPSTKGLADMRNRLDRARSLIDTAAELLQIR